jgi:hypothetical protein
MSILSFVSAVITVMFLLTPFGDPKDCIGVWWLDLGILASIAPIVGIFGNPV